MRYAFFDTDFLSKIGRRFKIDLIKAEAASSKIIVTREVFAELQKGEIQGRLGATEAINWLRRNGNLVQQEVTSEARNEDENAGELSIVAARARILGRSRMQFFRCFWIIERMS